jgi:fructose-1,6-bisphosphatase/inositol monophosphatase family enzyme
MDGGEKFLDELARVRTEVAAVRRFGSAALDLAWVAGGPFRRLLGARIVSCGISLRASC